MNMSLLTVAAVIFLTPIAVEAAPKACGPSAAMVAQLAGKYDERPLFWYRASDRIVMQVWGNPRGDIDGAAASWTVMAHHNNGISCVIAAGKHLPEWAADLEGVRL